MWFFGGSLSFRFIWVSAPRGCTEDGGRPPGAGLQEQAPNHLKLRWLKARVVSVKEKSRLRTVAGVNQGVERKRTTDEVSKINGRRQNWWLTQRQDKFRGDLFTA